MSTDQAQRQIPLLTEHELKDTIVFAAYSHMQASHAARMLAVQAQQNADTANMANKAADALAKQLKEAQDEAGALKARLAVFEPPAADPAPAPEATAEPVVSTEPLPVVDA